MTFEELQIEAQKQGYKLVKNKPYEKLLPCTCGYNKRDRWVRYYNEEGGRHGRYVTLICKNCGREVDGRSDADAKRNWNKEVSK